jgi:hypothetical protein
VTKVERLCPLLPIAYRSGPTTSATEPRLVPAREQAGLSWIGFHVFDRTCANLLFTDRRNALQSAGSDLPGVHARPIHGRPLPRWASRTLWHLGQNRVPHAVSLSAGCATLSFSFST